MRVAAGLVLALFLSACAPQASTPQAEVGGRVWVLAALAGAPPLVGTRVTLSFEEGAVAGESGCNRYGGPYRLAASALEFGALRSTRRGCAEAVNAQESRYYALLEQVRGYRLGDGGLELLSATGDVLLRYAAA